MLPVDIGFIGERPVVTVSQDDDLAKRLAEREKYQKIWQFEQYRAVAPGEGIAAQFLAQAKPRVGSEVIDFGSGTGRGALMLALMGGCKVHMLDFADNCLDEDVRNALTSQPHALTFRLHDLCKPAPISAQYGYCTDVMEHIPPEYIERVLHNVLKAAQHVFFQISCEDDVCGKLIGEPLHLSVHPYEWWHKKFQALGCHIHYSQDHESHCIFYVTAWQDGPTLVASGELNVTDELVKKNVSHNIAQGWQQVQPYETNTAEVMIVGGGPSLVSHLEQIRELRAKGAKLVTLNGAYNWCLEQGLKPSAQIMVDARAFNARFTKPVIDDCRYLIASQCDPAVFDDLPKDRTYLWHTSAEHIRELLDAQYPVWWAVPGGSTVFLRAVPLLRMLGFKRFHVFGVDSCFSEVADTRDDKEDVALIGHIYAQPENDADIRVSVTCGDRMFECAPWHIAQAQEFMDLIKFMGDEIELEVYGNGLISHILATGSRLAGDEAAKNHDAKTGAFE